MTNTGPPARTAAEWVTLREALAKFRNENIGFIFQDHHLLPQCTVLENVLIPMLAGSGAGQTEENRARITSELRRSWNAGYSSHGRGRGRGGAAGYGDRDTR